jgi:hypothetical protein
MIAAAATRAGPAPDQLAPRNSRSSAAVTTRYRGSLIALGHEHHDRADLSFGGKPQLGYRS